MNWNRTITLGLFVGALVSVGAASSGAQVSSRELGVAPTRPRPARVPVVPAGTPIPITLDENIPLKRQQFGKTFRAHVTRAVMVNGAVAIRKGAAARVTLVESEGDANAATLRLTGVSMGGKMRRASSDVAHADAKKSGLGTGEKTAIGAAAGAVVGAVTGAGVLKGAVVGAGGGLAWGLIGGTNKQVKRDTPLEFSLRQPLKAS
jgi:hypothetical protein